MPDREKVIIGLQCLTNEDPYMSTIACAEKKCPYAGIPDCNLAIWHDALELLKAQEPVPVYEDKISKCKCGETVCRYRHPKFCGFCGRELLWY